MHSKYQSTSYDLYIKNEQRISMYVKQKEDKCDDCVETVAAAKSLQSCPTLCDPIDGSPPGSPIPGILQARVPEWGAIAFSICEVSFIKNC